MNKYFVILDDMNTYQYGKSMDWVKCLWKNMDEGWNMLNKVWGVLYHYNYIENIF